MKVSGAFISGTSKYYTGSSWTEGTWPEEEKEGNFLYLTLPGDNVQTRMPGGKNEWVTVSDGFCIYRVTETSKKGGIDVKDDNGESHYYLTDLTLEAKGVG